ncbi:MAG: caspase family protein [Pseudorhodoplanes sp.]|uniref:WD40 domain-containing protein n=1 Tax=Pseudorhodoplanes sp. TaxID=1934341 RepID=UPI003D09E508
MVNIIRASAMRAVFVACICTQAASMAGSTEPNPTVAPQIGHASYISSLVVSADGRFLVSAGSDTVKLWDIKSGRLIRSFSGHKDNPTAATLSPDGQRLAITGWSKTITLWEPASGRLILTIPAHSDWVESLAFSPDGKHLLSASADRTVKLWDASSGQLVRTMRGHTDNVRSARFSPSGKHIASASYDKTVRLWDAATGKLVRTFSGHKEIALSATFSQDESLLASAGDGIRIWNLATGALVKTMAVADDERVYDVAFSPDARSLASVSMVSGGFKLRDIASGRVISAISDDGGFQSMAYLAPMQRVFTGSEKVDGTIKLWDIPTRGVIQTFHARSAAVGSLTFLPDAGTLAIGDRDQIRVWSLDTASLIRQTALSGSTPPGSAPGLTTTPMVASPNGERLFAGTSDGALIVIDARDGRVVSKLKGHEGAIHAVAVSRDGKLVLTGGDDYIIKLWNAGTGTVLRTINAVTKDRFYEATIGIAAAAFSPDGKLIVSGNENKTASIWDAGTGKLVRVLRGHKGYVSSVEFTPDGKRILTASDDGTLKLWEAASGRLLRSFGAPPAQGSNAGISASVLDSDGSRAVSGGDDRMMRVWNTSSGTSSGAYGGHLAEVTTVGFSRDGRLTATGSKDGTTRIWDAADGSLRATLIGVPSGEWLILTPEGFFAASARGAELLHVVRGMDIIGIEQVYQSLYRPDLVREKLAGDTRGLVRIAAERLDLDKVLASGNAPSVTVVSPRDSERTAGHNIEAVIDIAPRDGGVGRVEWRVNGLTVAVEQPPAPPPGQPLRLTRGLVLDGGNNEVEVVAYNAQNRVASAPGRATVIAPATGDTAKPRLFVLAVGLNEYEDADIRLKYSVPDANALVLALRKAGDGIYDSVTAILLKDAEVRRERLNAAFTRLAGEVRANDVFVFFIAGHGKTLDGRYYFIPQDFKPDGAASVLKQGIAQEQWQSWFASIPARRSILLFDTCESGSLTGEGLQTRALERGAANDRLVQATGRTVLTATSDTTDAFEGYRGHGLFTYNLLAALGAADSNANGTIELPELATYVHAQVVSLSEKVFRKRQEPQLRVTGNYAFARSMRVLADAVPEIAISRVPTHRVSAADTDLLIFPALGANRVRMLDDKTPLTLVRNEGGWALVAREGQLLGYVAMRNIAPLQ